jgi:hypothetical protein
MTCSDHMHSTCIFVHHVIHVHGVINSTTSVILQHQWPWHYTARERIRRGEGSEARQCITTFHAPCMGLHDGSAWCESV